MQFAKPAVLKPGVTVETLPGPRPGDAAGAGDAHLVRGKALIFWDPRVPRRSSTRSTPTRSRRPPTACPRASRRSTSGGRPASFRYLMPDFRARVHRGETFVIAGDRFAIGSSREMSPAGLKGVAEEVGPRAGRRLRPQHGRHLPPQRLQPRPPRRAEPRGGRRRAGRRRVHLRSGHAALTNETQGKTYDARPALAKEEEIRQSGGIFAVGRREFRDSVERAAGDRWPDPGRARAA